MKAREPERDVEVGIGDAGMVPVEEQGAAIAEAEVVGSNVQVHQ
jgi:hypothetical protein